ncbi:ParA family protein [Leptospira adleri]|uniref:ParA family protein n=1 Tax=Leptospira adleri TaxID=2023186 RepID=UPI001082C3A6|nr:ParA family protein [Leptospira adleri]TGM60631.1 ParA family protein [Leptospira adleri]
MYIVTLASLKGGVAKTTTAINLSIHLLKRAKRILCMDFDLNNNLTDFFLRRVAEEVLNERNVYHALLEQKELRDCIYTTQFPGIDILPATISLGKLGEDLGGDATLLLPFLEKLRAFPYDYIIIDTPVYLSVELKFALLISDLVLYPIRPARWNYQGTKSLLGEIEKLFEESKETGVLERNPKTLLVPSIVSKKKEEGERLLRLRKKYEVARTVISKLSAIETASELGRALKENTKGYLLFEELTQEILHISGGGLS